MALTKQIAVDRITVLADGRMRVREVTYILENGQKIAQTRHPKVIDVGDDVSGEPQLVRDVAKNMHTPARKAARDAAKAELDT